MLPAVHRLVGGPPVLGPDAGPSHTAAAVQDAERHWKELTAQPNAEPVDWATVLAEPGGLRKQQRVLSQALDKARRNRLQATATPQEWTCIQNCSGLWAAVWLTVPPTEHGLSLLDGEYSALVHFRLRAPLWPGGGPCRRTRGWYDPEGDHAHSCSRNSRTWTRRHQHLRNQIRRQLRWLGFWAETEQANSRLQHRPDICTVGLTLPTTYLEVHVSHPLTRGTASAHLARGSSVSAFVEEAWRRRLSLDYWGGARPTPPLPWCRRLSIRTGGGTQSSSGGGAVRFEQLPNAGGLMQLKPA